MSIKIERRECGNWDSCEMGERHTFPAVGERISVLPGTALRRAGSFQFEEWLPADRTAPVEGIAEDSHEVVVNVYGILVWVPLDVIDWNAAGVLP